MVSESEIISKYNELGNIWKVGEYFSISGQKVHSVLKKNGVKMKTPHFTDAEKEILKERYNDFAKSQNLDELAKMMGRTKQFICRKAKELGLTDKKRIYELTEDKHIFNSITAKKRIIKYGHPRGMLGKKHDEEFKSNMSERVKKMWNENRGIFMNEKRISLLSDKMSEMQNDGILGIRSRCYVTTAHFGENVYTFKSNWEMNMALYFEYLKIISKIEDWSYEKKMFKFPFNEYGVRTYKPDFIVNKGSEMHIIELKGWIDEKAKAKSYLMNKYYPNINIEMINEQGYNLIEKEYKSKINLWDFRKTIKNDNLCVKIVAEKFVDKENPRVEFKIVTIDL